MTNFKGIILALTIVIATGLFSYGNSHFYLWRSIDSAVVQKNSQPYPTARIYRSSEGVIFITLDNVGYVYFPSTQKIGMPAGKSFFSLGPLLFSDKPQPQVIFADGVKVEKADLFAKDNFIEFTATRDDRIRVTF